MPFFVGNCCFMVFYGKPEHRSTEFTNHTVECSMNSRYNLICQLSSVPCFRSDAILWEFMPNGAPPGSVTAHESKPECCMIKPLQGHDLLSFLKLLLTALQALPPSGLAPLSSGSVCRCSTVTSLTSLSDAAT